MIIKLTDKDFVQALQQNLRLAFETPSGRESMKFIETIGKWYPNILDSNDTNDVIARDANRKLIGTIKTLLELPADEIVALAKNQEE